MPLRQSRSLSSKAVNCWRCSFCRSASSDNAGALVLLSAPGKGDEIRDPVALQGEVVPSDLFGLAMPGDESPLKRA